MSTQARKPRSRTITSLGYSCRLVARHSNAGGGYNVYVAAERGEPVPRGLSEPQGRVKRGSGLYGDPSSHWYAWQREALVGHEPSLQQAVDQIVAMEKEIG